MEELIYFLECVADDPRIATSHISLYVTLWKFWLSAGKTEPLTISRQLLMAACKISSLTTYHKAIKDLDEYGYIGYAPSFNRMAGSKVYFTKKGIEACRVMMQLR